MDLRLKLTLNLMIELGKQGYTCLPGKSMNISIAALPYFMSICKNEVLYFRANGNCTDMIMKGGNNRLITASLAKVERIINDDDFFKSDKTILVNYPYINELDRKNKCLKLCTGDCVKISRRKTNELIPYLKRKNEKII